MTPASPRLEQVLSAAEQLPPDDRLRLIRHVAETLIPVQPTVPSRRLMYGEFNGPGMATEADFRVAEWQPSERELDGA
jgi:hypothetical protein